MSNADSPGFSSSRERLIGDQESSGPREEPRAWRSGMLRAILRTFVVLGAVAYVPSLWLSVRERLWAIAVADTVVYAAVIYLHLARESSDRWRAGGMLAVTYLLSVTLLAVLGPFGAGELWLFAFPILAGALIGVRAAIAALGLNLVTLAAFAVALPVLARTAPVWADRSLAGWVAISVNFLLLDTVVTLSIAMLVSRLDQALARVRYARGRLSAERAELLRANRRLRDQVVERQLAEQRRNELEKDLLQAQKMEAVGRLAGGIAHDFNNLLTAILGYTDLASAKADRAAPPREELSEIRRAAGRAADLTRQLLAFGRKQVLQPRVLSLTDSVNETDKMLRRLIGENVRLETSVGGEAGRVCADAGQVEQVIVNLAINARDALPNGGTLAIRTADVRIGPEDARRLAVPIGDYVELSVSDDGLGMDALTLSRIFEPFFTTKEMGQGTGLGLATVYGIVKQSGAQILVDSEPGRGTRFRILFPRVQDARAASPPAESNATEKRGSETILLVEDDENVRRLTRMILEQQGYRVLTASSGAQALEIACDPRRSIDLVLSDVVMPGMSGHELLDRISQVRPDVRALYMTGYVDDPGPGAHGNESSRNFLRKPFMPSDLARAVREALDGVGARS
jgi:signal transduction histidine kinase/ActR/RegA family two-component response regulator